MSDRPSESGEDRRTTADPPTGCRYRCGAARWWGCRQGRWRALSFTPAALSEDEVTARPNPQ